MTFSSDKKMLVFGGNFDIEYYSDVFEFSFGLFLFFPPLDNNFIHFFS